ncbi:MAG TPA: DUF423 domain-containing protein [Cyclobacteriaceae bacterium]|jgi:uncharacterized membrane protein YgdD (TMEM256/DUF423 family)|nr:DUF423 domain-containing protein [Cyclobacteriaceae bacterium]
MNQKNTLTTAAIMGVLAVSIGAFGAHALKPMLTASGRLETFELAVRYQFYHTLALLTVGILMGQFKSSKLGYAAYFFLLGIMFFSGSLYVLCFTGLGILGAVTPIGGVLFILGWIFLMLGVRSNSSN